MRLIDADALEKFLSDAEMEATKRKKYVLAGALNVIQGNVRNFPTIEPERKKGKWINIHVSATGDSDAECDQCGAVVHNNFSTTVNFCPNCGADLRGEEQS